MDLAVAFSTLRETFFTAYFCKLFKANVLSLRYPGPLPAKYCQRRTYSQSILEQGLSWPGWPSLGVSATMILRCESARVHCALSTARVKVIGHMKGEWGCGKGEESGLVQGNNVTVPGHRCGGFRQLLAAAQFCSVLLALWLWGLGSLRKFAYQNCRNRYSSCPRIDAVFLACL
jgi:hypothetical protein